MTIVVDCKNPEVSIVVPVFLNAGTINDLFIHLKKVLKNQHYSYEIIFVNDASPDSSSRILETLAKNDPQVIMLTMESNVGQHKAVIAGINQAHGKYIVIMDADLQDPPGAIPDLLTKMKEGYNAVFAGRRGRYESFMRLLTSRLFKWLLHMLCGVPADAGLFLAMDRQMVESLKAFNIPRPFLVAMIGCTGLPITSIPVIRARRQSGYSAYSSLKRFKTGCFTIGWLLIWKIAGIK